EDHARLGPVEQDNKARRHPLAGQARAGLRQGPGPIPQVSSQPYEGQRLLSLFTLPATTFVHNVGFHSSTYATMICIETCERAAGPERRRGTGCAPASPAVYSEAIPLIR